MLDILINIKFFSSTRSSRSIIWAFGDGQEVKVIHLFLVLDDNESYIRRDDTYEIPASFGSVAVVECI